LRSHSISRQRFKDATLICASPPPPPLSPLIPLDVALAASAGSCFSRMRWNHGETRDNESIILFTLYWHFACECFGHSVASTVGSLSHQGKYMQYPSTFVSQWADWMMRKTIRQYLSGSTLYENTQGLSYSLSEASFKVAWEAAMLRGLSVMVTFLQCLTAATFSADDGGLLLYKSCQKRFISSTLLQLLITVINRHECTFIPTGRKSCHDYVLLNLDQI
jgi:hypothetical protein